MQRVRPSLPPGPLALEPGARDILARQHRESLERGEYPAAFGSAEWQQTPPKAYQLRGTAAVISVGDVIFPRYSPDLEAFGIPSAEGVARAVRRAAADSAVSTIVLDIDSPGGSVFGIPEAADALFAVRNTKRIVAVANHVALSAAYWLAAQAHELIVTPAGVVGGVGVADAHTDTSRAREKAGIKTTLVAAGAFKTERASEFPLSAEARAEMQRGVDRYYSMFLSAVARGRGVSAAHVANRFGEGRALLAQDAVRVGAADRVGTLDEVLAELRAGGRAAPVAPRAEYGNALATEAARRAVSETVIAAWAAWNRAPTALVLAVPKGASLARWASCVHEAGHVVACLALGGTVPHVRANGEGGTGLTEIRLANTSAELNIAVTVAGGTAEWLFAPHRGDPFAPEGSAKTDLELLRAEVGASAPDLAHGRRAAAHLLRSNAGAVHRVALELAARSALAGGDVTRAAGALQTFPA